MLTVTADTLPRVIACNGSLSMAGINPAIVTENSAREEGIAAHWAAQMVMSGGVGNIVELLDRRAPNGVFVTSEMVDHVDGYLTMISERGIEPQFEVDTSYQTDAYTVRGRCDSRQLSADTLYIDDFKYGWRIVEPELNWTLISHAVGTVQQMGRPASNIEFTIFQPRPFHGSGRIRKWRISYVQLLEYYGALDSTLRNISNELRTGPHCHRCPSLGICPAARAAALNAVDVSETAYREDIPDEEISAELDLLTKAASTIKDRLDALQNLATHKLRDGKRIENYWLDGGEGNLKWNDNLTAETVSAIVGVPVAKPAMITPTQTIKKGAPEELVLALASRPSTGLKLVREDDAKRASRLLSKGTK